MTFQIIIKEKDEHQKLGKTRSEQEENIRKDGGFTMTDEQLDKCKYMERKIKEQGGQTKNFITSNHIDRVK